MIQNPILPGFHPDPSICRVGDDFYLVTSSFSFFPGVPVFHSRDLKNWEQLGYVLDRKEQLPCGYEMLSGGIFAPTIRYHDGVYYMITTNMSMGCKNFIVTADDPAGPWSDMHIIEGADGIDPSLFFDEDGKAYYTGTTRGEDESGDFQAIWCSEIDVERFELKGERKLVWRGAMIDAIAPEGPHLYKKDGYYYLMIAEGGTEVYHAVTIARSEQVFGPYRGFDGNPILTHRHLGKRYPICNVGHADLVELSDGSWYMVMLASRLLGGSHKLLGRETFLAQVSWEDGWPVVNPGKGIVEMQCESPAGLSEHPFEKGALPTETDTDFSDGKLGLEWNEIGTPGNEPFYRFVEDGIELRLLKNRIVPWDIDGLGVNVFERIPVFAERNAKGESGKVSFLGRRLQHVSWEASTVLSFAPEAGEHAGLVIIQNDANQLRIDVTAENSAGESACEPGANGRACEPKESRAVVSCIRTQTVVRDGRQFFEEEELASVTVDASEPLTLRMSATETAVNFGVQADGIAHPPADGGNSSSDGIIYPLASDIDAGFMGSESCGGFIGAYVGIYAGCEGADSDRWAKFKRFCYRGAEAAE